MLFLVHPSLFERFPGLVIGVVVGHDLQPPADPRAIEDLLTAAEERLRHEWGNRPAQEHPRIAPWREAFRTMGLPASRYLSSIEALARRVLSGRGLPRILPLVDLYNAVSLSHQIPVGGHDLAPIAGPIRLAPTRGGEAFQAMFSNEVEVAAPYEVAYQDDQEILTRHWVWRQGHKDRITPGTRSAFIPVDGLPQVGIAATQAAVEEMADRLRDHFGGNVRTGLVTAANPLLELGAAHSP